MREREKLEMEDVRITASSKLDLATKLIDETDGRTVKSRTTYATQKDDGTVEYVAEITRSRKVYLTEG